MVKTGGILAMSTKPDFNLNQPFTIVDEQKLEELETYAEGEERTKK